MNFKFRYSVFILLLLLSSCGGVDDLDSVEMNEDVRYVDNLLAPYVLKLTMYESVIKSGKEAYINDLNNEYAVTTNKDVSFDILNRYLNDTESINDEEWKRLQQTIGTHLNILSYEDTQNLYGFESCQQNQEEFIDLSEKVIDHDFIISLIDHNLESEDKNRYQDILNNPEVQNLVLGYRKQFKNIDLIVQQVKTETKEAYDNAVSVANSNKIFAEENLAKIIAQKEADLKQKYDQGLEAIKIFLVKNQEIDERGKYKIIFKYTTKYKDNRESAEKAYERELKELRDRAESIKENKRLGGSKINLDFDFGVWEILSEEERQIRKERMFGKNDKTNYGVLDEISNMISNATTTSVKKSELFEHILENLNSGNNSEQSKKDLEILQSYIEGIKSKGELSKLFTM